MVYEMRLGSQPFNMIKNRIKTVELRLFDEKRSKLNVGDKIIFCNLSDDNDRVAVIVKALYRYESFGELFDEISLERCGNNGCSKEDAIERMRLYYSEDEEKQYGVIGIKIEVTDLSCVLEEQEKIRESAYDRLFPDGMK